MFEKATGGLTALQITDQELLEMLRAQPSLRAPLLGHTGRYKLKLLIAPQVSQIIQQDDHKRSRRGTLSVVFKGKTLAIRCVSLQSSSIRTKNGIITANYQCDASDKRAVDLPDGGSIETTCALASSFDIVAVSLFAALERWEFAFASAKSLEKTQDKKIPPHIRPHLLATHHKLVIPVSAPYTLAFKEALQMWADG